MRKWMLFVPLLLGMAGEAWAQETVAPAVASEVNGGSAGNFNRKIWAMESPTSTHDVLGAPVASAALAAPAPEPQVLFAAVRRNDGNWGSALPT